ncbi:hypothetical protein BTJ_5464 [Burkholderia thailandensis E444]|nr:hypothetical protein BTJ_5464 [Burkholderia thailandensis E444]AIS99201.1 hypothetical protein BTHA_3952 [Burkholderia thailandensis MSMB59]AIT23768.1 hypothetical protein BTN_3735 [Burkholderia thailandensis E254]
MGRRRSKHARRAALRRTRARCAGLAENRRTTPANGAKGVDGDRREEVQARRGERAGERGPASRRAAARPSRPSLLRAGAGDRSAAARRRRDGARRTANVENAARGYADQRGRDRPARKRRGGGKAGRCARRGGAPADNRGFGAEIGKRREAGQETGRETRQKTARPRRCVARAGPAQAGSANCATVERSASAWSFSECAAAAACSTSAAFCCVTWSISPTARFT